jgi:integrase
LGHKDISTTLDVYTDVTKEQARSEFSQLDEKLKINATAMMALAESEK